MIHEVKAEFEFRRIKNYSYAEVDNWQLTLKNKGRVYEHLLEYIVQGSDCVLFELDGTLKKPVTSVKRGIMGYYRAEVLPKALYGLLSVGYDGLTEKEVDKFLNKLFFSKTIYNDASEPLDIVRSLSDANDDEMRQYCTSCIVFIEGTLGVKVQTAEEYHKEHGNVKKRKR